MGRSGKNLCGVNLYLFFKVEKGKAYLSILSKINFHKKSYVLYIRK